MIHAHVRVTMLTRVIGMKPANAVVWHLRNSEPAMASLILHIIIPFLPTVSTSIMELSVKLNKEQKHIYIAVCELAYGCWPVDVIWAIGTDTYKATEQKLILAGKIKMSSEEAGIGKKINT